MFVVDRPRFDRHPADDRHTRLLCGDRVVINSLERTDWGRGKIGADEISDPEDARMYGGPLNPHEGTAQADVTRLGDHVALLRPVSDIAYFRHRAIEEPVLFAPAAWRAVRWRAGCDFRPPLVTRRQLLSTWLDRDKLPEMIAGTAFACDAELDRDLPHVLRRIALAADPGELPAALAAVERVVNWANVAPGDPAPGVLLAPADAGPVLTFYLDADGFPEWPALTAAGRGVMLGGWAFRPDGL